MDKSIKLNNLEGLDDVLEIIPLKSGWRPPHPNPNKPPQRTIVFAMEVYKNPKPVLNSRGVGGHNVIFVAQRKLYEWEIFDNLGILVSFAKWRLVKFRRPQLKPTQEAIRASRPKWGLHINVWICMD